MFKSANKLLQNVKIMPSINCYITYPSGKHHHLTYYTFSLVICTVYVYIFCVRNNNVFYNNQCITINL